MLSLYVQQAVSDVRSVKSSVNCGKCAAKCPTKVIQFEPRKPKVVPKVEKPVEEQSATE